MAKVLHYAKPLTVKENTGKRANRLVSTHVLIQIYSIYCTLFYFLNYCWGLG